LFFHIVAIWSMVNGQFSPPNFELPVILKFP
jgi:hypothetical protein